MGGKLNKKPTKRPNAATKSSLSTTEDLIALKKIKLLQEGKLNKGGKRTENSSLVNKINHNADKVIFTFEIKSVNLRKAL